MNIVEQIREQLEKWVDPIYSEELSIIEKRLEEAWEIYDYEHLLHNVPTGSELYHMGKFIDFAIEDFQFAVDHLEEEELINWHEDPTELNEEMTQQEELCLNIL